MAMSRGRRISKRQKRRSLKRKNAKSRKVMRGGGKFTSLAQCNNMISRDPNLKNNVLKITNNYINPCKTLFEEYDGTY